MNFGLVTLEFMRLVCVPNGQNSTVIHICVPTLCYNVDLAARAHTGPCCTC